MSFILGLTGSIGMGKSTTATMFRAEGVPVHDADAAVHALYAGEAAPLIEAAFPGATRDGVVDRSRLAAILGQDGEAFRRLEAIIHPLVRDAERAFLAKASQSRAPLVVLDVPLLFETGGAARCDAVVVVTAPPDVQRARTLARPGMSAARFEAILARQIPDAEKRRRAHFLVDTSLGMESARGAVRSILRALAGRSGKGKIAKGAH
ncbi:MAG: dephospho-CoA kinase [Bosea sp. (in: a-proteobacteria)]